MTDKQSEDIALKVVAKLKDENAFRGCPLTRDEQGKIKEVARMADELIPLAAVSKKGRKYVGLLFIGLLYLAAKDIYGWLSTAWGAISR